MLNWRSMRRWEEYKQVNKSINPIISDKSNFEQIKQRGVGQTTILKFLGKNWKQWMIQDSLKALKVIDVDRIYLFLTTVKLPPSHPKTDM
jgi:hypothetical protein